MARSGYNNGSFPFEINGTNIPHLADVIFSHLDKQSLIKCRRVSKSWKGYVDSLNLVWSNVPIGKRLRAAKEGMFDISRLMLDNGDDPNPSDDFGITPLHVAAAWGHHKIVELIIGRLDNKNPASLDGITPLHRAAEKGHYEICELIIGNVLDRNPRASGELHISGLNYFNLNLGTRIGIRNVCGRYGRTPLHMAAKNGHLSICKLIIENVRDKNPRDIHGRTPLHLAALSGNCDICALILANVEDKHPIDFAGVTPLHCAVSHGHTKVAKLWPKKGRLAAENESISMDRKWKVKRKVINTKCTIL